MLLSEQVKSHSAVFEQNPLFPCDFRSPGGGLSLPCRRHLICFLSLQPTREDVLENLSCAQAGNQVKIERTWLFLAGGTKGEWMRLVQGSSLSLGDCGRSMAKGTPLTIPTGPQSMLGSRQEE